MPMTSIADRVRELKATLPPHVDLVAAAKTRSSDDIRAALDAGVRIIGHNYVQEAQNMIENVGREAATWTFIGHLQRNKVKLAVQLFDGVQTVDSIRLAEAIDRECHKIGRIMPILIEINAAREPQKSGVAPEDAEDLIRELSQFPSIHIEGLMTMGPLVSDPESLRPTFRETKVLFDTIASADIPGVDMIVLSMGMSASYGVAIEEGATMIRLGTTIFGPRT
jgi:PLP dependent protein